MLFDKENFDHPRQPEKSKLTESIATSDTPSFGDGKCKVNCFNTVFQNISKKHIVYMSVVHNYVLTEFELARL